MTLKAAEAIDKLISGLPGISKIKLEINLNPGASVITTQERCKFIYSLNI